MLGLQTGAPLGVPLGREALHMHPRLCRNKKAAERPAHQHADSRLQPHQGGQDSLTKGGQLHDSNDSNM